MKCTEIRKTVGDARETPTAMRPRMADHARGCRACRDLMALDALTSALINARQASSDEAASNPFLAARIRNRIREMREQNLSSWEMAVAAMPSLKGWLAAFAMAAFILIAISFQWRQPAVTSDLEHETEELNIQNSAERLISDVPDSAGKDDPYAYK